MSRNASGNASGNASAVVQNTSVLQHPGYDAQGLQLAAEQLPCREVQAGMLLSLMGEVGVLMSIIPALIPCRD